MPQFAWPQAQKPGRGATLDVAHPLARGLVSLFALNEGSGPPVDAITGVTATSNGAAWAGTPYGLALAFNGTSQYVDVGNDAALTGWSGPITIACLAAPDSTQANQHAIDCRTAAVGGYYFSLNNNSTNHDLALFVQAATSTTVSSATGAVDGGWHVWGVSMASTATGGIAFYRDGQPVGTGTAAFFPGVAPAATRYLGTNSGASAAFMKGPVALILVANRAWLAAEHAAFARNPWQIFRVQRVLGSSPTVFTPAAVGGMVLGGARSPAVSWSPGGLGGAVLSGLAIPSASWTPPAAGGTVPGGAATPSGSSSFTATPAGGAKLAGATTPAPAWTPPAAGGAKVGGVWSPAPAWTPSAAGGAKLGGSAAATAVLTATASGGAVLGGVSAQSVILVATASGGPVAGGGASGSISLVATASGGAVLGGAVPVPEYVLTASASGGIVFGGAWLAAASATFISYVDPRAGTVLTARGATALSRVDPRAGTLIMPRVTATEGPPPPPISTTSPVPFFVMSADGVTPYAGPVTVRVRTPLRDWDVPAGTVVSDGSGLYTLAATSDDTAGARPLLLYATATGAGPGLAMWWDVATPYRVGQLGVPIPFWLGTAASSGNLPAVGAAAQLVLSTPGGTAAAGLGSVIEAGNGYYLYYPTPADVAAPTVLYAVGRADGAISWAETYTIGA